MLKDWLSLPEIWTSVPLSLVFFLFSPKPKDAICPALTFFFSTTIIFIAAQVLIGGESFHGGPSLTLGAFHLLLDLDLLSAIFLVLLGVVALSVSLFSSGYLRHFDASINRYQYWLSFFLFLGSMALVLVSADAISFIIFWELMSLSSGVLVATEHTKHKVQRAALIYLASTRIAGAFLMSGFLWMNALSHSWRFVDWHFDFAQSQFAAALIILGFLIKAGSWPFHIWLPYAHPAAPATVSALMSGVMIKIAIYGLIRIFVFGRLDCPALAYAILFFGTVSMFWGVLFALVQTDLKRVLAYSSVENIGIALVGVAVSLLARSSGYPEIASLALAAATFHCVGHGLFKSLLFIGAGTVDAMTHTRDLSQLGGLAKNFRWTTLCFLIGCLCICALPPLNGFVSKWITYQSLFQVIWQSSSLLQRSICLALVGVLSVVGGLSLACFVNTFGVTFLGKPRSRQAASAHEGDIGMIASQFLLTVCCVGMGCFAPAFLFLLKPICDRATNLDSQVHQAFNIPMLPLALALLGLVGILYGLFIKRSPTRQFITWECGFGELSPRTQVTPTSFSQPLARIFGPILRYKIVTDIQGEDRRHFPQRIEVEPHMVSILEKRFYRPAISVVNFLSGVLAKLQAGSIHLYLAYLCLTLTILLVIGTRL